MITNKIVIDLNKPSIYTIYAKQIDSLSRSVDIVLLSNGKPFSAEEATLFAVQYKKADGKRGFYTELENGEVAVTKATDESGGTLLMVRFAKQTFTTAGKVSCSIVMMNESGYSLGTFSFTIIVEASEANGISSADYFNFPTLENLANSVGNLQHLATQNKSDLVSAINEIYGAVGEAQKPAAEYTDKTEGFLSQTEYKEPMEYIRSLGVGSWKVVEGGSLYMAKVMQSDAVTVRFERTATDDEFFYDEIWLNDKLVYSMDTYAGEILIAGESVAKNADTVHYRAETKTDAEKQQARNNIGAIGEDDATEMEVTTAATALLDKDLDNKLITPAAVTALLDMVCPPAIVGQVNSDYSESKSKGRKARAYDSSKEYAPGDVCYVTDYEITEDDYTRWYVRKDSTATGTLAGDFDYKGRLVTLPEDTDMRKYELAAQQGNVKFKLGNYYMPQSNFVSEGPGVMRLVFEKTTAEALMRVNLYYFVDTGKIVKITYSASGVSST